MEEDNASGPKHHKKSNPKIHDVIKKEVEKLLESGLIYPISDSPWVSPVHCVPKKGGITVVMNEENDVDSNSFGLQDADAQRLSQETVTRANVKEKTSQLDEIASKHHPSVKSLTFGGSSLWARSRLLVLWETKYNSARGKATICQIGLEAKALPTNDARVLRVFSPFSRLSSHKQSGQVGSFKSWLEKNLKGTWLGKPICRCVKIFSVGKLKSVGLALSHQLEYFRTALLRLSQCQGPNFKVNGHRVMQLLWRESSTIGSSRSQTFPKINKSCDGQASQNLNKRFVGGTHAYPIAGCEDSSVLSFNQGVSHSQLQIGNRYP
ncbi:hypothetical protein Tco_1459573 [Tanacetum coccineum]